MAPGADDELDDPVVAVEVAAYVLRGEPLVVVVVAVEDDVDAGAVEDAPDRPHVLVLLVAAGGEARMVVGGEDAAVAMAAQIADQPPDLRGPRPALDRAAVGVQDDDVPAA